MKYKQLDTNSWIVEVQENGKTKQLFIEFPPGCIDQMGWFEDDVLEWTDNKDGSINIQKKREGIDSTSNN